MNVTLTIDELPFDAEKAYVCCGDNFCRKVLGVLYHFPDKSFTANGIFVVLMGDETIGAMGTFHIQRALDQLTKAGFAVKVDQSLYRCSELTCVLVPQFEKPGFHVSAENLENAVLAHQGTAIIKVIPEHLRSTVGRLLTSKQ